MRIPAWARWLLAAILIAGIATAGVAANLAVLGSEGDDVRLGTLSALSVTSGSTRVPRPGADDPGGYAEGHTGGGDDDEHDDD